MEEFVKLSSSRKCKKKNLQLSWNSLPTHFLFNLSDKHPEWNFWVKVSYTISFLAPEIFARSLEHARTGLPFTDHPRKRNNFPLVGTRIRAACQRLDLALHALAASIFAEETGSTRHERIRACRSTSRNFVCIRRRRVLSSSDLFFCQRFLPID